jgi:hypothetical protein
MLEWCTIPELRPVSSVWVLRDEECSGTRRLTVAWKNRRMGQGPQLIQGVGNGRVQVLGEQRVRHLQAS